MSTFNDYVANGNNTVNDNKYNAKKARSSPAHQIKQLLRPLISLLKKRSRKSTYCKNPQPEYFVDEAVDEQNRANELLEQRIFQEIDSCHDYSAVPIYTSEGRLDILPVCREHRYIPVHFARTDAGTFFWTSITGPDSDIADGHSMSTHQTPQLQTPCDRWAQA